MATGTCSAWTIATEEGAGWLAVLRSLVARGLSGVQAVIADAHEGLEATMESVLAGASWQRCRTHAMRNLLTRVPKASRPMVATLARTICEQPDSEPVWVQQARVVEQRQGRFRYDALLSSRVAENLRTLTEFAAAYTLPCDAGTARVYGEVKEHLRRSGRPIPEDDVWIAAIGLRHRLTLITRDAHFQHVAGLRLESW